MSDDPANFYARLASAQAAEDRRESINNPRPQPPVTTTLDDLKKRATAAEFTLIEAIVAAIYVEAANKIRRDISTWVNKNPPDRYGSMREWAERLSKYLSTQTP